MRRIVILFAVLWLCPSAAAQDVDRVSLSVNVQLADAPLPGPSAGDGPAVLQFVNRGAGPDVHLAGDSATDTFEIAIRPGSYDVFLHFQGAKAPGRRPVGQYRAATALEIDGETERVRFAIPADVVRYVQPQVEFDDAWACEEAGYRAGAYLHFVSRDGPARVWNAAPATEIRVFEGRYDVWAACALSGPAHHGWARIATDVDPTSRSIDAVARLGKRKAEIESDESVVDVRLCAAIRLRERCSTPQPFERPMSVPVPTGPQRLVATMRRSDGRLFQWDVGPIPSGDFTRRIGWARAQLHLRFDGESLNTELSIVDEGHRNVVRSTPVEGKVDLHLPAGKWQVEVQLPDNSTRRRTLELKPGRSVVQLSFAGRDSSAD